MIESTLREVNSIWRKNRADLKALLSGSIQRLLNDNSRNKSTPEIPVFVFHSVEPVTFERQLNYLVRNDYATVNSNALVEILRGKPKSNPRTIALTFDDATGSFWATAFPLLKKYGFCAILFAIPALVPDDNQIYPNLEDVWAGRASLKDIQNRELIQPLCTWTEIATMHVSGIVDIQSHSLTHSRINISPKILDFIHPKFDTYFYENVNIPVARYENPVKPSRMLILGRPVYQSASRLSGYPRFLEDTAIGDKLVEYVSKNGNQDFFSRSYWRQSLKREYRRFSRKYGNQVKFETPEETKAALKLEFSKSKQIIEWRLNGKAVHHFCYPWFQGSDLSDRIAGKCGFQTVYYGSESTKNNKSNHKLPFRVRRISEEYLFCLPGVGKRSLLSVWSNKFYHLARTSAWKNRHSL